jgi:hypothetical protein
MTYLGKFLLFQRWPDLKLAFALTAFFVLGSNVLGQQPTSIVLLDVSGSMEKEHGVDFRRYSHRYSEGKSQMQELTRLLGTALDKQCRCPVLLAQFSSAKEPAPLSGPFQGARLPDHIPDTARGRETQLDFALQLGLQHSRDGLLFIITDNKNDFGGNQSDREFYSMLAGSPAINSVYFVPLAEPNSAQDALVLYGIAAGKADRTLLRSVVSDFATAMKSEAVQFRPLYEQEKGHPQINLSQKITQFTGDDDEHPAIMEGDSIVAIYDEGHPLDGGVRFKLHSNLKHWRIVQGSLTKAQIEGEVPQEFLGAGHVTLPVNIHRGKTLHVDPGGDSVEIYTMPLSGLEDSSVALRRSGLFRTDLPDVHLMVHLNAVIGLAPRPQESGLQPVFSKALQERMRAVRNLPEIMNSMTFQNDTSNTDGSTERVIPVSRELIVRIRPDRVKNALARLILFGLPLLLLGGIGGTFLMLRSQHFTLVEPSGRSRVLEFSFFKRNVAVQWNGRTAASLKRAGNGLEVVPERGYKSEPLRLPLSPTEFELTNTNSGASARFRLQPGIVSAKSRSQKGTI